MAQKYRTILTKKGKDKMASLIAGQKIKLTHLAVGDGELEPNEEQTSLQNEQYRGDVQKVEISSTKGNRVNILGIIPKHIGGFWIREVGVYDSDGDLIAIGNVGETYKSLASDGSDKELGYNVIIEVDNIDNINLEIDESIIFATKEDISKHIEQSVRDKDGVHGLRVQRGKIEYKNKDGEWEIPAIEASIFGVVIDGSNANPNTRVTYIEDSIGFIPVRGNDGNTDWGSWKDTFIYEKFKPCVVKGGEVQYYLNKEDFTKKEGGGTANLTGTDGDVMIEIGKMWYKIETFGDKLYVRVSDTYQDGFKCLAHTRGNSEVDKIYVGAYLGYEQSGKLRSISGVEPTSKRIGDFRTLAEANGDRYHQVPFTALTLLQTIMVILLKSTDTQTALGRGHSDDDSSYSKTGNTNKKGMVFGETGGQANTGQMCFMGIEDFWGNKRWWIDGLKYDDGKIKLATTNFNNNANGYEIVGYYSEEADWGYIKSVKGTTETGFIPTATEGSSSTYFCDGGAILDDRFPDFGGPYSSGSNGGGFSLSCDSASISISTLGSRLFMYGKQDS